MKEINTKKILDQVIPDHRWYYQHNESKQVVEIQIYSLGINNHCEVVVHNLPRKGPSGDVTLSLEEFNQQYSLYNP